MEPRKIQQVGKSTLTVSLPSDWAERYGVEKGDHVYLFSGNDSSLTIYPSVSGSVSVTKVTLDAEGRPPIVVERSIVGSYVLGRKEIVIESESEEGLTDAQTDAIYRAEEQLMGAGVIEERPSKAVLRFSVNPSEFSVNDLLGRLNSTAETMRAEAVETVRDPTEDLPRRGADREKHANKVFVLILRLLLTAQQNPVLVDKIGLTNPLHIVGARAAAKSLERCADYAAEMSENAEEATREGEDGSPFEDELVDGLEDLIDLTDSVCDHALESLRRGDIDAATQTRDLFEDVRAKQEELVSEAFEDLDDVKSLMRFNDTVSAATQSAKEGVEIAEVGSNRALESSGDGIELE
ncbi:MAG: phosphate uptake regulator PhoU [Halobacteria archaeon]|nr:phosphate uptake regulator PhoU [Halobacteria archaeon]